MTLIARTSGNGGDYTPAPEGTHTAICVKIIDLGTAYSEQWDKTSHEVLVGWELPSELNDKKEPFIVWRRYTLSLHEKSNLRKDLKSWRTRDFTDDELEGFHLKAILGKPCLVNIVHKIVGENTYANIVAVMALPKETVVPSAQHGLLLFDIEEDFDKAAFDTFSKKNQDRIMRSEEMIARNRAMSNPGTEVAQGAQHQPVDDDSIPF